MKKISAVNRPLLRIIIPAFPGINVYTKAAQKTTALGPVMVATAANKRLFEWDLEILDENNFKGPRDSSGLPDHYLIQRQRPASVVGFYGSLSCTTERIWELAQGAYKDVFSIAGGSHVSNLPEESLRRGVDLVVHGQGERVIAPIIIRFESGQDFKDIPGVSFLENGKITTNDVAEEISGHDPFLERLPLPDFGLLRNVRNLSIYPVNMGAGCSRNCEFCAVKGKARWRSAERLFNIVKYLADTRRARHFFIVDDRLEENLPGIIKFFQMIKREYGNKLWFMVQMRLDFARERKNIKVLRLMKEAGVAIVAIGCESPIDRELRAMNKGYRSSDMVGWLRIWQRFFKVHVMLIAGYPLKHKNPPVTYMETVRAIKQFLGWVRPASVQVLLAGPAPGTRLRERLEAEGRLLPLEVASWSLHDGQFALFKPEGMSFRQLQRIPLNIMDWFYGQFGFVRFSLRTIVFPFEWLFRGWKACSGWRTDAIRYIASRLVRRWEKDGKALGLLARVKKWERQNE